MTKEEAIKIIRKYECNKDHYEACEMAIKALEAEDVLDKNTECKKTHCGWLNNGSAVCFNTSKKEFAKLDEHGEAIAKEIIDTEERT
jgi:hypothetical protein